MHGTIYHVTAICEPWLLAFVSHRLFLTVCKTVRGVNIGVGHGSSMSAAKREASAQALVYLKSHGKHDPRRLILGTNRRKF